jgi:transposase-like protein
MELSNFGLPRKLKERMIREYLSGMKTAQMLSDEYGMSREAISKMISRHKDKFLPTFEQKSIILPTMKQKPKTVSESDLMREIEELRRQLNDALLKIEGYEIMGDILAEQYGVDLLKKSAAKPSSASESDTQKQACAPSADCLAIQGKPIINS